MFIETRRCAQRFAPFDQDGGLSAAGSDPPVILML